MILSNPRKDQVKDKIHYVELLLLTVKSNIVNEQEYYFLLDSDYLCYELFQYVLFPVLSPVLISSLKLHYYHVSCICIWVNGNLFDKIGGYYKLKKLYP